MSFILIFIFSSCVAIPDLPERFDKRQTDSINIPERSSLTPASQGTILSNIRDRFKNLFGSETTLATPKQIQKEEAKIRDSEVTFDGSYHQLLGQMNTHRHLKHINLDNIRDPELLKLAQMIRGVQVDSPSYFGKNYKEKIARHIAHMKNLLNSSPNIDSIIQDHIRANLIKITKHCYKNLPYEEKSFIVSILNNFNVEEALILYEDFNLFRERKSQFSIIEDMPEDTIREFMSYIFNNYDLNDRRILEYVIHDIHKFANTKGHDAKKLKIIKGVIQSRIGKMTDTIQSKNESINKAKEMMKKMGNIEGGRLKVMKDIENIVRRLEDAKKKFQDLLDELNSK